MKFKRNLTNTDVVIDMTSMIDVVFILLLFFMLTTTFTRPSSLQVVLPEANGQNLDEQDLRIEIVITKSGSYQINGRELASTEIEALMQAITDLAVGDNTLPVTLTGDAATTHQSVVTAMDALARLGFSRINIAIRQSEAAAQ